MDALFNEVRRNCSAPVWSRGVELARTDAVQKERDDGKTIELRVATQGGLISPQVVLYVEDAEWQCECNSRDDVCVHAAAAVIALRKAKAEGKELGTYVNPDNAPAGKICYFFTRAADGLALERYIVSDLAKTHLATTLAALAQKKVKGPKFVASQVDLQVELLLGTQLSGVLPRATLTKIFAALIDHPEIFFETERIAIKDAIPGLSARIEDRQGDFIATLMQDASIREVFANGVALCSDGLRPLTEVALSPQFVSEYKNGKVFRTTSEISELVSEIIPKLQKLLPVEIRTQRLPTLARFETPRLHLDLSKDDNKLCVLPILVYGDPPIARIDGESMVHLQGPIPMRDLEEEKRLLRILINMGLTPGHKATFTGQGAAKLTLKLQQLEDDPDAKLKGVAHHDFYLAAPLVPRLDPQHLDFVFESPQSETSMHKQGGKADPQAVIQAWQRKESLVPLLEGGMAPLPAHWLNTYGQQIADLLAAKAAADGTLPRSSMPEYAKLCQALNQTVPPELFELQTLVNNFSGLQTATLPNDLQAELRHYQQEGVNWLAFLRQAKLGGLLADDMGLGKTLQALCAITGKTLIVAPTSVIFNWQQECARFRPTLRCNVYHGSKRQLDDSDVTLTTYALLRLDIDKLATTHWNTIVLDEAQAIKNPESQAAQAAFRLQGEFKLTLTGTPVENRLDELWSQFHFNNRGLLGGLSDFQERYAKPIEQGDAAAAARLRERIKPFVLRRLKRDVAKELPPRTDVVLRVELSEEERHTYNAIRAATLQNVIAQLEQGGNVLQALEVLLRLRQACCHAGLLPNSQVETSSKIELLLETLLEVTAENHKSLVFSQWTALLDKVEPELRKNNITYLRLDGSTQNRGDVVAQFQQAGGPPVLLVSLKAGGTGLNLTAADNVFLLDPWWNPAVEDQAADRAHRIGQANPVLVHRLIAADTVEERILALQQSKRVLAQAALEDAELGTQLSRDDLLDLLRTA
jgi:superfamily II DNA or RNA helicase